MPRSGRAKEQMYRVHVRKGPMFAAMLITDSSVN